MPKINLLDPAVSELIAAGEVIERPSSIVKELLENSIDAGSTAVTVEIKNGGISFIRITDNGCGMEREDVPTAFLRHATSKVSKKEDLDHIQTLGFRGEALASIAAVTHLELMTKTVSQKVGTHYVLHGGMVQECSEIGCPDGTTFVIRDLFYNVPARLKFLKKGITEGTAVQSVVEKIALSHPEVSVRMIRDNHPVLHTPGDGKLLSAIYAVLGKEFAHALIEVSYDYQGIKIEGYTIKSEKCRKNRTLQNFFVNDRFVKSKTCVAALEEAYVNAKMIGKFPACVLKLYLPCDQVDVNVHPAKIEVRFVQEKLVYDALYFAVKSALTRADILTTDVNEEKTFVSRPVLPVDNSENHQQSFSNQKMTSSEAGPAYRTMTAEEYRNQYLKKEPAFNHTILPKPNQPVLDSENSSSASPRTYQKPAPYQEKKTNSIGVSAEREEDPFAFLDATSFKKKESAPSESTKKHPESAPKAPAVTGNKGSAVQSDALEVSEELVKPFEVSAPGTEEVPIRIRMIGELFKTYILFEANELFVMIDKHAAHERILFEQLKSAVDLRESQILLTPLPLTLSPEEIGILQEHAAEMENLGFHFSEQNGKLCLTEAPLILHRFDLADIVEDLAEKLANGTYSLIPEQLEDLLHSMACRAAIKANQTQSLQELSFLVREVYQDERIRHCPHGRPVGITMTRYDIENKFGRHG